jgi:hypothetical protein
MVKFARVLTTVCNLGHSGQLGQQGQALMVLMRDADLIM